jgi:hypothetical protein
MSEETLKIGFYYYIDEETGEKVYDTEEMRDEFEFKLDRLWLYPNYEKNSLEKNPTNFKL